MSTEDIRIFETKIIPFREGKKLTVTELPERILRYKFNNYESKNSLFQLNNNFKIIYPNIEIMGMQPNMIMNLDEKFSNIDCFDSNFLSNYPVIIIILINFLIFKDRN